MAEEECREMARNNYAAQMEMLGYQTDGNPRDMVEVVRCKDCKFHHASEKLNKCWCEKDFIEGYHNRDWYCADGERKEE